MQEKKKKEPRICEVCGKEYIPRTVRQRTCGSDKCMEEMHRIGRREYEAKHPHRNSERYRKLKTERRVKHIDSIIGEGYAERQIADSLRLAGKVRVEL